MKRHDTADPISGTARADGDRIDLTIYDTVKVHMKIDGAGTYVEGVVEVLEDTLGGGGVDPEDGLPVNRGKWRYAQVDGDVDTAGVYDVELECVLSNGKKVHFPSAKADNDKLTIDEDIDDA